MPSGSSDSPIQGRREANGNEWRPSSGRAMGTDSGRSGLTMQRLTVPILVAVAVLVVSVLSNAAAHPNASEVADFAPATDVQPEAALATGDESGVRTHLLQAEIRPTLSSPEPYIRSDYAPAGWDDTDGDCQSDRHEVLIDESLIAVTLDASQCRVETGLWIDRFDGRRYTQAADVTIDHLVALSAAHRAGAWQWDLQSKRRFAHDLEFGGALGVVGSEINQAKADKDPGQWRPPLRSAWCAYATDWINVKQRWGLAFANSEVSALHEMLDTCTTHHHDPVPLASPTNAKPTPPPPPPTAVIVSATAALIVIGNCDARAEIVTLENRGATGTALNGWILHDHDKNHVLRLDGHHLAAGQRLRIASGEHTPTGRDLIVWKHKNVWNNSGDTATLIAPDSTTVEHPC